MTRGELGQRWVILPAFGHNSRVAPADCHCVVPATNERQTYLLQVELKDSSGSCVARAELTTLVGPVKTLGHPVHYSATPAEIRRGAPLLGEHTDEVLAEYGYACAEIEKFASEGAVLGRKP